MANKTSLSKAITLTAIAIALLLISGGCAKNRVTPTQPAYSTDINELRARFNADKGRVRLLLILSPT